PARVVVDEGGELGPEDPAHILLRVRTHDREHHAMLDKLAEECAHTGEERDRISVPGLELLDVAGDERELPGRDPQAPHHLTGAVAAEELELVLVDLPEPEPVGDGVDRGDEPGEGVREGAVEVEDEQSIFHNLSSAWARFSLALASNSSRSSG